jgi:hypothetical protein
MILNNAVSTAEITLRRMIGEHDYDHLTELRRMGCDLFRCSTYQNSTGKIEEINANLRQNCLCFGWVSNRAQGMLTSGGLNRVVQLGETTNNKNYRVISQSKTRRLKVVAFILFQRCIWAGTQLRVEEWDDPNKRHAPRRHKYWSRLTLLLPGTPHSKPLSPIHCERFYRLAIRVYRLRGGGAPLMPNLWDGSKQLHTPANFTLGETATLTLLSRIETPSPQLSLQWLSESLSSNFTNHWLHS